MSKVKKGMSVPVAQQEPITLPKKQLVEIHNALTSLGGYNLPQEASWAIVKNKQRLKPIIESYSEEYKSLQEEFTKGNEISNPKLFSEKLEELQKEDATFLPYQVKMSAFKKYKYNTSTGQMEDISPDLPANALMPLIEIIITEDE